MRMVLLGGAPGAGKTTAARELLGRASRGSVVLQWVDVDGLWSHQPWRVDETTVGMLHANLRAVLANAADAEVDVVVITWVFQSPAMHELVRHLAPTDTAVVTVQLRLSELAWRERWCADPARPDLDDFFEARHRQAEAMSADHVIPIDGLDASEVAAAVAAVIDPDPPSTRYEPSN